MKLSGQLFVIGCMILSCSSASAVNLRKRRQSDFVFPDRLAAVQNRGGGFGSGGGFGGGGFGNVGGFGNGGGFGGGFNNGGGFGNANPFFGGQQGGQQQQSQGRVPFPTPIQPGPPAIIDAQPQESGAVVPDTVLTTPSPSFNTCYNSCPTTSEYNPICGTNRQLYFNQQKFDCAIRCGAQVQVWRRGSCEGLFAMMRG